MLKHSAALDPDAAAVALHPRVAQLHKKGEEESLPDKQLEALRSRVLKADVKEAMVSAEKLQRKERELTEAQKARLEAKLSHSSEPSKAETPTDAPTEPATETPPPESETSAAEKAHTSDAAATEGASGPATASWPPRRASRGRLSD